MATDVLMPQMGESIFEGTITKWLKKPGDKVQRDEPLFEISTDKVDAEIPAPAAGVLKEIKVKEGATVQVNTIVGVIDAEGSAVSASTPAPTKAAPPVDGAPAAKQPPAALTVSPAPAAPAVASQAGGNGGPGVDVVMPQMGESIFEGTITKWLKKVGDKVQRDEPLFEISTDKVDAEIPAPAAGVLREIKAKEGSTVQVNTVVAVIGGSGAGAPVSAPVKPATAPEPKSAERKAEPTQPKPAIEFPAPDRAQQGERIHSSPLVRRIARESNIDLSKVSGTGLGGRITKDDIQNFIQQHGSGQAVRSGDRMPPETTDTSTKPAPAVIPATRVLPGELVPMTKMRSIIAQRMVESKHTSAHVHTVFKVDMTRIAKFREKNRKAWEARNGVKLTFMPFVAKALMHGIRALATKGM